MAEKNKQTLSSEVKVKSPPNSGISIKIRWIRIVKDGTANRLLFAGTQNGSSSLTGGHFDTDNTNFDTWFDLLLTSFNSPDTSPVYVNFTSDSSSMRNYTYYEQITWPAYTPPEYPAFTSLNLPSTAALT